MSLKCELMASKKTSAIEDLMDISAKLPWQVGVGLAVVAYLVLHYFASKTPLTMNPVELKTMGKSIGDGVVSHFWSTIVGILQYIIPFAFLVGAGVSALRKKAKSVSYYADSPSCPKCGALMLRRTAKSGSNAGNNFWGCSKYPACRGVRN